MQPAGHRVRFLASVTTVDEAALAAAAGADFIDCKDASSGALGALPVERVRAIARAVRGAHEPAAAPAISATIGDVVADGAVWTAAASAMAAAGVDYVKIGIFPGGDPRAAIEAVGHGVIGRARLFGVLLADRAPDLGLVEAMARAGFAGVMLDTAAKDGRALPDVMARAALRVFVAEARRCGVLCGLAGSLGVQHVAPLAALGPDMLGFRGALCVGHARAAMLDPERVRAVRDALRSAQEVRSAGVRPDPGCEASVA